jgi:hypothetical protein
MINPPRAIVPKSESINTENPANKTTKNMLIPDSLIVAKTDVDLPIVVC